MKLLLIITFCIGSLFLLTACMGQIKAPTTPISFVDETTGEDIAEVLVIPVYGVFSGTSTLGGHGPGSGKYIDMIAHPFVYSANSDFEVQQPKPIGVGIPPFAMIVAEGISLEGVVIISQNHIPHFYTNLFVRPNNEAIPLKPLTIESGRSLRQKLISLLSENPVDFMGLMPLKMQNNLSVLPELNNSLTSEEYKIAEDFLQCEDGVPSKCPARR